MPLSNLSTELHEMFEEVIRRGSQDHPGDMVARMYISPENLSDAIIVRPRPLSEMTAQAVMEAVMTALNSNKVVLVTDKFQIQLGIAQLERRSGHGPFSQRRERL